MDKSKILRLCDEIEDNAKEIRERTVKNSYFMEQTIINRVLVIRAEITAPPKTNADRIRQMTDEELVSEISRSICENVENCENDLNCYDCRLQWLKQVANEDAGTDD